MGTKKPRIERPEELLRELPPVSGAADVVRRALDEVEQLAARRETSEVCCPETLLRRLPPIAASPSLLRRSLATATRARASEVTTARYPLRLLRVSAVGVGVVGVIVAALIFAVPPRTDDPPALAVSAGEPPDVAAAPAVVVRVLSGTSLLARGGETRRIDAGQVLEAGDVLTTEAHSDVVLDVGLRVQLTLDPSSALRVVVAGAEGARFTLTRGRAEGTAARGEGARGIGFVHEGRFVELVAGRAGVVRLVSGEIAVAALDTAARLLIDGREVSVPREHVIRISGTDETSPEAAPPSLSLRISQSGVAGASARRVTVSGRTSPIVELTVNGEEIRVEPDGKFLAQVAVGPATSSLDVVARDPLGRSEHRSLAVRRGRDGVHWKMKEGVRWKEPG